MLKVVVPLNVKTKFYAKCEKSFGQLDDQSDGQFGQFRHPGQFFQHFFFLCPGCQHFRSKTILESVMICRESVTF